MGWLFIQGYVLSIVVGTVMRMSGLKVLHRLLRRTGTRGNSRIGTEEQVCRAMDYVCVFYPWQIHCLQRSAATKLLLRAHGIPADLVIGVQPSPYKWHAWVIVNERIVNDKPYMREIYSELERC